MFLFDQSTLRGVTKQIRGHPANNESDELNEHDDELLFAKILCQHSRQLKMWWINWTITWGKLLLCQSLSSNLSRWSSSREITLIIILVPCWWSLGLGEGWLSSRLYGACSPTESLIIERLLVFPAK